MTAVQPFRQYRTPGFSRILHWPPVGLSGVTLGRGYDMGNRSAGEVYATLRQAELEEYKASLCARAAGLKGKRAGEFVKVYGPLVGEITHQQQIGLFEIAYKTKLMEAQSLYRRLTRTMPAAPAWNELDPKIRDVVVDIFYQGVHKARGLIQAAASGKAELIKYIRNDREYMGFEQQRNRIGYLK